MSKTTYKVASVEGAERYGIDIGETVDVELTEDQERALLAAGWLEETTKKPKEEK